MHIVMFYHSLVSDWNHGNAHFLRGVVRELSDCGQTVDVYEPRDGWSVSNMTRDHGTAALDGFRRAFPTLRSRTYTLEDLDLDRVLDGADLVLAHEWNEPELIARLGQHRKKSGKYLLLFHDTHHRAVTAPEQMAKYELKHFDGVLAFGDVLRDLYLERGWTQNAWTWHEAADARLFKPMRNDTEGDFVWVGNWGDEERTAELQEYLIEPVRTLGLKAVVYGVRYPDEGRQSLADAGIDYRRWLPNYEVPKAFSKFRFTIHVPRRPYAEALPGIPTIRVFEALACGIPLISAPWRDAEQLFSVGEDFLMARNGQQMRRYMQMLLNEPSLREYVAQNGRRTVLRRHTCAHRAKELLEIAYELGAVQTKKGASV